MALARTGRAAGPGLTIPALRPATPRASVAPLDWIQARALFVVAVSAVIGLSLAAIPGHLAQDGWLALVAGRAVATHGIPHHDIFTVMAHGARWVDQQWLAQLAMYELVRFGGLQLMTVVYVLITGAAFAFAVAAARELGGEDLHVLMVLPAGAFFYLMTAVSIRTQGFAYPLFVATVWLLAADARGGRRHARVYWVFPILVLWANVHGSVTIGAGLACLYGVTLIAGGLRRSGLRGLRDRRGWAFTLLPPLMLLATPYGTGIVHYYHATLMNSEFARLVTEWRPLTSIPFLAVTLALTVVAACWVIGAGSVRARTRARAEARVQLSSGVSSGAPSGLSSGALPRSMPIFDLLALAALTVGSVLAVRNVTWFGLALVVLLPSAVTLLKGAPAPLRRSRANGFLALAVAGLTLAGSAAILTRPATWFQRTYPAAAVPTLERLVVREPQAKIFADVRYADWLVWQDPQLFAGRIAYDTSFELLSAAQLSMIADPAARSQERALDRYAIWVLYPFNHTENRELLRRPGVRTVLRDSKIIIATLSSAPRAGRQPK